MRGRAKVVIFGHRASSALEEAVVERAPGGGRLASAAASSFPCSCIEDASGESLLPPVAEKRAPWRAFCLLHSAPRPSGEAAETREALEEAVVEMTDRAAKSPPLAGE